MLSYQIYIYHFCVFLLQHVVDPQATHLTTGADMDLRDIHPRGIGRDHTLLTTAAVGPVHDLAPHTAGHQLVGETDPTLQMTPGQTILFRQGLGGAQEGTRAVCHQSQGEV